jgi:signal transduction histidine kinase
MELFLILNKKMLITDKLFKVILINPELSVVFDLVEGDTLPDDLIKCLTASVTGFRYSRHKSVYSISLSQRKEKVYIFVNDITENLKLEYKTKSLENLLNINEKVNKCGSMRFNFKGYFESSKGLEILFGKKFNNIKDFIDILSDKHKEIFVQTSHNCLKINTDFSLVHQYINQTTMSIGFLKTKGIIHEKSVICNTRDITENYLLEMKLLEKKEKANKDSEMKTQFVKDISRSIRTPLNGVLGMVDILKDLLHEESQLENICIIKKSCDILLEVIGNVIGFSSIQEGNMTVFPVPFNVNDTITEILGIMLGGLAKTKDVIIETELNYTNNEQKIVTDKVKFRQIILNLLSNAIKFTPSGKITIKTENSPIKNCIGNCIKVSITDTGIGMNEDTIQQIFKPFRQADRSTTRNFGGSGLGMNIAKTFVDLLGGTMTVESVYGVGSKFSVIL